MESLSALDYERVNGYLIRFWFVVIGTLFFCNAAVTQHPVLPGVDVLLRDSIGVVKGKRLGVVCNRASTLRDGRHLLEAFQEQGLNVVTVLTPEHGFDAALSAGQHVRSGMRKGVPFYSLYGNVRKPTAEMLKDVDALVFDLQDVGSRFYTYISTMGLSMQAAAENDIPFIILDRPNPITGRMEGPILDTSVSSFVGMYPIPLRHGLTPGELAEMICRERWMELPEAFRPRIIPLRHWRRSMWYDSTRLDWLPPSPNITDVTTALLYSVFCLLEGTTLSEGRGTETPFHVFGSPTFQSKRFVDAMRKKKLPGVHFVETMFTPRSSTAATNPKYAGQKCFGVRVIVTDRDVFETMHLIVSVIPTLSRFDSTFRFTSYFDKLVGIRNGADVFRSEDRVRTLLARWKHANENFQTRHRQYFFYQD